MPRSNSKDDLEEIKEVIKTNFKWFDINFSSEYPGWEENPNSEFIQGIKKKYDEVMKEKNLNQSEIVAYHAWLECGALVKKLWEDAQVVSIWPTIKGAHTTEENCDLKSVEIIWEILVDYLN
jgi:dipeptidase D